MHKSLLVGCGNIGALYDLSNDKIITHAKAYSSSPFFELTIFDKDYSLVKIVADKYNCDVLNNIDDSLKSFDCISICTPTTFHFELLEKAITKKTKLVICEKPISINEQELNKLLLLYKSNETFVLVNYFRRFLPKYDLLQSRIKSILRNDELKAVSIKYQRGFLNNCSHALDLLQYLFNQTIDLHDVKITNKVFDHFDSDPTISMNAFWDSVYIDIIGLPFVKYSYFEIDLFFNHTKISIKDAGNTIEIYSSILGDRYLNPLFIEKDFPIFNCLENYMESVMKRALEILDDKFHSDNFCESLELNLKMLKIINL